MLRLWEVCYGPKTLDREFAGAVDAPSDGLIRLVAPALALMLGMMAISFVAGDKPSPLTNLLSTVTEWTGSQPSAAGADSRVLDRDGASRANDDGYLEGLQKAGLGRRIFDADLPHFEYLVTIMLDRRNTDCI
jgi:hypothetical protein